MKRHVRDEFYVLGEGILTHEDGEPHCRRPSTTASLRKFRFSRLGPLGEPNSPALISKLGLAMTAGPEQGDDQIANRIPAGYTYLGQFIDHDLTMDATRTGLGTEVTVDELLQGRSPALDLDSVYGRGPYSADRVYYDSDGVSLKMGATEPVRGPGTNVPLDGFDLPRVGIGATRKERRIPLIPDERNDENLAVAQTHLAFLRFHNRVIADLADDGVPTSRLFDMARDRVVKHYQWMVRTDFLTRVVDTAIVDDVFTNGRRFFEVPGSAGPHAEAGSEALPGDRPTMPIEFSVAAYRFGHSMIRSAYQWNRIFRRGGVVPGTLFLLFVFSGTSGNFDAGASLEDLNDPNSGTIDRLPTNWIADFRRLYDFGGAGIPELVIPPEESNLARPIDTLLVDPLRRLPAGSFGARGTGPVQDEHRNLAFRNLTRGVGLRLASGQQMAELFGLEPLKPADLLAGNGGAVFTDLTPEEETELTTRTPLWFYILRESELNGGRLTGVGGRIIAETFHRAIEGSKISIVRDPFWRPTLGPNPGSFTMVDLLRYAFEDRPELLNPLGG
ncbi:peroxidase family protein [Cryptosporangium aurantiacum]|uniref:Animal haem peroxidase n=1 Tax=Cryptosporangium aurantiacum TaxID=134849 RepID=A0A1M7RI83_9ACTN|nr:heme peroxidase family protein [Cryptosporangium aurantiacum]SHN45916.1 Animal haem peroxidase [Cryptosporangium aurantiacum]